MDNTWSLHLQHACCVTRHTACALVELRPRDRDTAWQRDGNMRSVPAPPRPATLFPPKPGRALVTVTSQQRQVNIVTRLQLIIVSTWGQQLGDLINSGQCWYKAQSSFYMFILFMLCREPVPLINGVVLWCGVLLCCCAVAGGHRTGQRVQWTWLHWDTASPPAAARPATTTANVRFQFSGDTSNEYFSGLHILSPHWDGGSGQNVQPGAGPRLCGGGLI